MESCQQFLAEIFAGMPLALHIIREQAVTSPEMLTTPARRRDLQLSAEQDYQLALRNGMKIRPGAVLERLKYTYLRTTNIGHSKKPWIRSD